MGNVLLTNRAAALINETSQRLWLTNSWY